MCHTVNYYPLLFYSLFSVKEKPIAIRFFNKSRTSNIFLTREKEREREREKSMHKAYAFIEHAILMFKIDEIQKKQ